jgi:glutaredoxin
LGKIPAKYRSKAHSMADPDLVTITDAVPDKGKGGSGRTSARKGIKEKERFSGTIEMYVTAWCPVCVDAEAYIKDKNYPYVKYDVEKDSSAKARAAGYPGRGVPLIVVGGRNFRGFSPKTLEYYMGK